MRVLKKSFGRAVTLLLLLMFSAAIIPMDFYHNHAAEETVCNDRVEKGTCQHKLHLSKKSKSCWACVVHYDKSYVKAEVDELKINETTTSLLSQSIAAGYYVRLISTSLRGPPIG